MNVWILFFLIGFATMIERLSFILLLEKWAMPNWLIKGLKYVPVAVLLSFVSPDVLRTDGVIDISILNPKIIGATIAAFVAWRTTSVSLTIGAGMVAFMISEAFI
jgi:branched-subunit amino acid transport protein